MSRQSSPNCHRRLVFVRVRFLDTRTRVLVGVDEGGGGRLIRSSEISALSESLEARKSMSRMNCILIKVLLRRETEIKKCLRVDLFELFDYVLPVTLVFALSFIDFFSLGLI